MHERNSRRTALGVAKQIVASLLFASLPLLGSSHSLIIAESVLQQLEEKYGSAAARRVEYWARLVAENQEIDDSRKLRLVNDFFNQASFVDDEIIWGVRDYWATPLELLIEDAGDCEDYSIAKYFSLRALGIDEKKLRLTYVTALELNQAHMVLAYYPTPSSIPLLLDNLDPAIRPADERTDLQPVYSFNADDLWLARSRTQQLRAGTPAQLGPWQDILARIQAMEQKLRGEH